MNAPTTLPKIDWAKLGIADDAELFGHYFTSRKSEWHHNGALDTRAKRGTLVIVRDKMQGLRATNRVTELRVANKREARTICEANNVTAWNF